MRRWLIALLILACATPAFAQRGGRAPPPVAPARVETPAERVDRTALVRDERLNLRREAARAAAQGYAAADVLAAYERDIAGHWFKRGEIVIVSDRSVDAALASLSLAPLRRTHLAGAGVEVVVVAAPAGQTAATFAALRRALPDAAIDLNYLYVSQGDPQRDTPSTQPPAEARSSRVPRAVVGIVDGALPTQAPEVAGVAFTTRRFVAGPVDDGAHAGAVAAILARSAAAAELRIVAADVVAAGPLEGALAADIARALDWAAIEGAGVINVSLTGPPSMTLAVVSGALAQRGHIIVAAAGNDGPRAPAPYPAALPSVIAVTAVDERQHIWRRATRGAFIDVAALGVNVTVSGRRVSGTSYAAPIVAGVLARWLPVPDASRAVEARAQLAAAAHDLGAPGPDPVFGLGLIEAQ